MVFFWHDLKLKREHLFSASTLLAPLFALCLFSQPVISATTYDGTNGVRANVLISNSVSACSGCHDGVTATDFTSSYSAFSSYATSYHAGSKYNAVSEMMTRTSLNPGEASFMPDGSGSQISSSEKSLLSAWRSNGSVQTDYPTTNTSSTVTGLGKDFKTSSNSAKFTAQAYVDDSGIDTTYYSFHIGLSIGSYTSSSWVTINGSGGGTTTTLITNSYSDLECGTLYYFRVRAYNSTYGYRYGSWKSKTMASCNTAPVIQNTPLSPSNATEDILWQLNVDANDDGEGDSTVYSLSNEPAGMSINSSSGLISWIPIEGQSASGTVTVTAADNGADGVTADTETFSISVTSVNDEPGITSSPGTNAVELNQYSYQLTVNDPDHSGNQLSYSLSNEPAGMLVSNSGEITWTPAKDVTTSGLVEVTVTDPLAASDSQSFTISVASTNTEPRITSSAPTSANEDQQYQYSVQVFDTDDANNGVDLRFSLESAPDGMAISSTGFITWTPLEGQGNVSNITVVVADGGENNADPASETFSISVSSINDEPSFNPVANQVVLEKQFFNLDLGNYLLDPDDLNDGSGITWTLVNGPLGLSLSELGALLWLPGENTSGVYIIEIQVKDGLENSSQPINLNVQLTVSLLDDDSDGIADYVDNCINTSNADQLDTDADGQGNACDLDDDGDGLSDVAELNNNLNPLDASDALLDSDEDGLNNLDEYLLCVAAGDAQCDDILTDTVPPEITTTGTLNINSRGYLTKVDLTASAVDVLDGAVIAVPDQSGLFRPGKHTIVWRASDAAGNEQIENQGLNILPQVRFGGSLYIGEGQAIELPITLNGSAPMYPVLLNFSVQGSANNSDHDLVNGQIELASGTDTQISFNTLVDNVFEEDETLNVILESASEQVVLIPSEFNLIIVDRNVPPMLKVGLMQAGKSVAKIYQDQGNFTITGQANDANNDNLAWQFNEIQGQLNLNAAQGNSLNSVLDPALLSVGFYQLDITVSDGSHEIMQSLAFHIKAAAPSLTTADSDGDGIDDMTEGLGDSDGDGLADYRDAINDEQYLQQSLGDSGSQDALKAQAGLSLKMGSLAREFDREGARISSLDIIDNNDSSFEDGALAGNILDFEVHGLSPVDPFARIIVPLDSVIPIGGQYWKYDGESWVAFDDSEDDYIGSALSQDGICPSDESDYQQGLTAFDDCILLIIEDGGNNDADAEVNGIIKDPSVLVIPEQQLTLTAKTAPSRHSGGSGYLSRHFLALLCLYLLVCFFKDYSHRNEK